jgi:23S rRNA pseudouridine2605 synthase
MGLRKIQLIIRDSGIASRRGAEEMIVEGRVTLNGQIITDPVERADPERDHIKVDGKLLRKVSPEKSYFLFNKPRHVVSTMDDPEDRPCIGQILKPIYRGLFPVGRLDFDAEGLMILTNDGTLAQKLSHPSNQIPRTYLVKVKGNPTDEILSFIRRGMSLGEGDRLGKVEYTVIRRQKSTTWIKITLYEGKKNELKRIFFRINHPVRKLRRISFGPFHLGTIPVGQVRPFSREEHQEIRKLLD